MLAAALGIAQGKQEPVPVRVAGDLQAWADANQNQTLELPARNPELAELLDFHPDGRIGEEEAQFLIDYLFMDPAFREPHRPTHPLDERVDRNRDRKVEAAELIYKNGKVWVPLEVTSIGRTMPAAKPASIRSKTPGRNMSL
jgi:hypothetical protein